MNSLRRQNKKYDSQPSDLNFKTLFEIGGYGPWEISRAQLTDVVSFLCNSWE